MSVGETNISEANDLESDRAVLGAATPGPWTVNHIDDDIHMNALVIARAEGTGELDDHRNNIAIVLLQTPRYADVDDGRWHENANFIVQARGRWPVLVERVAELNRQIVALQQENAD